MGIVSHFPGGGGNKDITAELNIMQFDTAAHLAELEMSGVLDEPNAVLEC